MVHLCNVGWKHLKDASDVTLSTTYVGSQNIVCITHLFSLLSRKSPKGWNETWQKFYTFIPFHNVTFFSKSTRLTLEIEQKWTRTIYWVEKMSLANLPRHHVCKLKKKQHFICQILKSPRYCIWLTHVYSCPK